MFSKEKGFKNNRPTTWLGPGSYKRQPVQVPDEDVLLAERKWAAALYTSLQIDNSLERYATKKQHVAIVTFPARSNLWPFKLSFTHMQTATRVSFSSHFTQMKMRPKCHRKPVFYNLPSIARLCKTSILQNQCQHAYKHVISAGATNALETLTDVSMLHLCTALRHFERIYLLGLPSRLGAPCRLVEMAFPPFRNTAWLSQALGFTLGVSSFALIENSLSLTLS